MFLSEISLVQAIESQLQDQLTVWQKSKTPLTEEIVLVKIKESDLVGLKGEQAKYAALVEQVLASGAAVVVLNLLDNWTADFLDQLNPPLQSLVETDRDRIVLVTPTAQQTPATLTEIETYYHLLPPLVGDDIRSAYDVTQIQGFFEFENNRSGALSPARLAQFSHPFYYNDPAQGQTIGTFKSAPALAIEKYHKALSQAPIALPKWPIRIPFRGQTEPFVSLTYDEICPSGQPPAAPGGQPGKCADISATQLSQTIQDKIVIVGFIAPQDNTKVVLPVHSPFGVSVPGLEVQAHTLAGLLTQSAYQMPPRWLIQVIIVTGASVISSLCASKFAGRFPQKRYFFLFLGGAVVLVYTGASLVFWSQQVLMPIALPILTWLITGTVIQLWLLYQIQQSLIAQQRYEIAQLKSAESGAVILQTRKLLQRIASGIHDGPLQELRLVMDKLELEVNTDPDTVVEKLSDVGIEIRNYLQNIRRMADALKVTPELRQGLATGITTHLQHLKESGTLTLMVYQNMQTLPEPSFNSQWIDAREDIFQFFREAIANVIAHAQPPHGHATQLKVSLMTNLPQCSLIIENDNAPAAKVVEDFYRRGGYGIKMMETVARSLPNGTWTSTVLPAGGYRAELSWQHQFTQEGSYDLSTI
ncbi:MAG: CHASE2 domain-containing protein [Cyanobacteria bacterium P01_G01_bin.38]